IFTSLFHVDGSLMSLPSCLPTNT
ncbi:hypothetical protein D039_3892B, partial [Vibrio parahaemolyticus EKP-028]